ncbi:MAG: hypothetical protein II007_03335 [Gammaproteobacteria bacterium]|nr:hypothetical protein [Gammaproteobacteria bacterium]
MSYENEDVENIISSLDIGDWSLSDEREFIENLHVGRFNYFLVVFSLFMTAGFANSFTTYKSLVFYIGAFVLILVWLPLYRGYKKHDRILKIIFRNKANHPANKIEKLMELEGNKSKYRVSKLMGIYIPGVCILVLFGVAIAISSGCIK